MIHYGPWRVTISNGDTAVHHEVYASSETQAIAEALEFSDFMVNGPEDEERYPDAYVIARRIT